MLQQASPKMKHILLQMSYLEKNRQYLVCIQVSPVVADFLQPELSQSSYIIFDCFCFSHF